MSHPLSSKPTALQSTLALMLIGLLLAISSLTKLFQVLLPQDEAILLLYPDLILRGYVPYRDFASLYPPGNFYLLAGAFHLFGMNIFIERFIGVGYQFLMAASVYFLGSRVTWTTGFLAAAVMLGVLHFFPAPGAYSMFGALSFVLLALVCSNRGCATPHTAHQKRWSFLAGLLTSTVYWFRQDVGIIGTLAVVVSLCPRNLNQFRFFVIGFAVPACALMVFTVLVGPARVLDSLVLDVLRMAPGRKLPIKISPWLVALIISIVVNIAIAFSIRRSSLPEHFVWLTRGIALLSAGLLPSVLQRADSWHVTYAGTAIAGLTVTSLSILLLHLNWRQNSSNTVKIAVVITVTTIFGVVFARGLIKHDADTPRLVSKDRWVLLHESSLSDANNILMEINRLAIPGAKLFVGPNDLRFSNYNDTFFYYLLPHLRPASRYLEMNPGAANRPGSELENHIASADWLILTSRYHGWMEQNASMVPGSSLPNEMISRHFCVHSEHGVWQLLRRCERSS